MVGPFLAGPYRLTITPAVNMRMRRVVRIELLTQLPNTRSCFGDEEVFRGSKPTRQSARTHAKVEALAHAQPVRHPRRDCIALPSVTT